MSAPIRKRLFLLPLFIHVLFFLCPAQSGQLPLLSDSALVELTQKQTFGYFWDFAHPVSGLARERSNIAYNYGNEVVTTGG
jgi:hypothetical protein